MKSFYDLVNANELKDELMELIKSYEFEKNEYQTDVYLYVDEETNTGSLYEFVNIGGNSWLNDDHYVLYIDKQHHESIWDFYMSGDDLAELVGLNPDDFDSMYDVIEVIKNDDELMDKVKEDYIESIEYELNDVVDNTIWEFDHNLELRRDA